MCASFKLSSGDSGKMHIARLATPEQIKSQELRGLSHIAYDGVSHFLYIESETDRNKLKDDLVLFNYEWFKEETGNRNWVLYNPKQFKVDRNKQGRKVLKFNKDDYTGGRLELPINASSCCGMFSWVTIPDFIHLGRLFNTKDIKDMSLMFAGCVFPKNFKFNEQFSTQSVEDMRYMFYECAFPQGFQLGEKFDTGNVKTMEYMFARSKISQNFYLPDEFNTSKTTALNHMFYESTIPGTFSLGKNFIISPNANTEDMFLGAVLDGIEITAETDNFSYIRNIFRENGRY